MKVYISGPMTGQPDYNRRAFIEAECEAWRWLHEHGQEPWSTVVNPARWAHRHIEEGDSHEVCMLDALGELLPCDAIWMLEGWEQSEGARLEHEVAVACGLAVLTAGEVEP